MGAQYKYLIDLLLQTQGFTNNMNKVQGQLKGAEFAARKVRSVLLEMGGALGLTYGISQLTQITAETIKLAAKAEGVKTAFDRIDDPGLLNKLRKATSGTVSDLELMTKTVNARNFKISMEALPIYFEFASKRALETGKNVDYLVESLVTGVGRKSVLWLDNLGLSITQINEELKKTPDFAEAVGKVIEREMKAAGDIADTTATKIQSITASWENMKLAFGQGILGATGARGLDDLSEWMEMLSASDISTGEKLKNWIDYLIGGDKIDKWKQNKIAAEEYFSALDKANTMRYIMTYSSQLDKLDDEGKYLLGLAVARYKEIKAIESGKGTKEKEIKTLETLNTDIQFYNDLLLKTNINDKASILSHKEKIKQLEAEKKAIEDLGKVLSLDDLKKLNNITSSGYRLGTETIDGEKAGFGNVKRLIKNVDVGPDKLILPKDINNLKTYNGLTREQINNIIGFNEELELEQELVNSLENTFLNMFSSIDGGFKAMAESLLREMEAIALKLAAKAVIFGILKFLMPGGSIVAEGLGSFLNIPKFAEGGLISGPTVGLMGEYPGARHNPEVVAPLSNLKSLIAGGGQGNYPESMRLALDGQGNLYGYLKYRERHLNNYK